MWADNETDKDFINFDSVAQTIAEIIDKKGKEPVSIGVSGSWGVGKSSLIKLVNKSLVAKASKSKKKYIFVEFNAWLYQGYDDARAALMESIADKLVEVSRENKTVFDKAQGLLKRVKWLRLAHYTAKTALPIAFGMPPVGIVGDIISNAKALIDGKIEQKDLDAAMSSATKLTKQAQGFLGEEEEKSPPKEIQAIRDCFEQTLKDLDSTLIVLIDDLDRCLPDTTISTLEAIRLFLFLPNTAFVIAADKQMIRHAVKKHFDGIEDDLVTNYFDKLIQIPIQVPPLGTQDVRAYMMLLFVENCLTLTEDKKINVVTAVNQHLKQSWKGNRVDRNFMSNLPEIKDNSDLMSKFELVERLAPIMTSSPQIKGNPRLIKRFLNALSIRMAISHANGIGINEDALAKMLLFERCGETKCYDELLQEVNLSGDGKSQFLQDWEGKLALDPDSELPTSWNREFEKNWLRLEPKLGGMDLRGIIYVSREYAPILNAEDQLSSEASQLLTAIIQTEGTASGHVKKLQTLLKTEQDVIMSKLLNKAKSIQEWGTPEILDDLMTMAGISSGLNDRLKVFLLERPISQITPSIIPRVSSMSWANEAFNKWTSEGGITLKKAIEAIRKGKS